MIIGRFYRVNYHKEDAFPEGEEWIPDKTHDKDFKVFTHAVEFALENCNLIGACGIYEIDIDFAEGYETEVPTDNTWEVTHDGPRKIE